jgi:gliding motility-associated-like protein
MLYQPALLILIEKRFGRKLSGIIFFLFFFISSSAQLIGTVAGNGSNGTSGNGGPAICAGLPAPSSVCIDVLGDFYITSTNSIGKVFANTGMITTIAGSDAPGYSGDGGPATKSSMQFPFGICLGPDGSVYVTEYAGHRIRRIDPAGNISTIAGTGTAGFSGDGGPAKNAALNTPKGICADKNGNLYIADTYNSRIRKINLATGIITTIGGDGTISHSGDSGPATNAGIPYPVSVCIDLDGNLYLAEVRSGNTSRIRKINASNGVITTIAGDANIGFSGDGGLAVNAELDDPAGVCVDRSGNVYISEYDHSRIRKIAVATGVITTMAGNGSNGFSGDFGLSTNASLNSPIGLCSDNSDNIFFADNANNRIRKIYVNLTGPLSSKTSVSIAASSTTICSGDSVTFTAQVINGGINAHYQWKKNGNNVGPNNNTYIESDLKDGDVITCTVIAINCSNTDMITSNSVTIKTSASQTPAVSISASATSICMGTTVTFTASGQQAGTNPSYQWKINGNDAGTDSSEFASSSLSNGDVISCVLVADPSYTCVTQPRTTSNTIAMQVSNIPAPTISIRSSDSNVCPGTPLTFSASAQNAGSAPAYSWKVNGTNVGTNSATYTTSELGNNDEVYCVLTADNACASAPVSSQKLQMNLRDAPVIVIEPTDTVVASGSEVSLKAVINGNVTSYEWSPATALQDAESLTPQTKPIQSATEFVLHAVNTEGCSATGKAVVKIFTKLSMPNAFTPNGDGRNDIFRIPGDVLLKLKDFSIFDRWGNRVFSTSDISKGWDGYFNGKRKDAGVYVYQIRGTSGDKPVVYKGTFVLVY